MALSTIGTGGIADSAISTAKIAADAVTAVKIDDDGTGFTFGDLTVSGAVVGDGFVSVDKLKLDSSSVATVTVNSAVSASATIVVDGVAGTIVVGMVVNVSDTTVRSITDAASQSAISTDDTLTITAVASQTSFTVSEAVTIPDNVVLILISDESGGFVLDSSASGTDVGEEILFEDATGDVNTLLNSRNVGIGGTLSFDNSPAGGGSRVLLLDQLIQNPILIYEINEEYINGTYDEYELRCMFILVTDSKRLEYDFLTTTSATGAGLPIGGDIYGYAIDNQDAAGERTQNPGDSGITHMECHYGTAGSAAGEGMTIRMQLFNANETRLAPCSLGSANYNDVNARTMGSTFSGGMAPAAYVAHYLRGIRFFTDSGGIESGSVKLFGVR